MPVVTIFDTPQVVNLVEPAAGSEEQRVNYPQNRTDFRLTKGVTNHVEFFLRDIDRRPVSLTGRTVVIRITERRTGRLLLTRTLSTTDADKALLRFTVQPDDIEDWELGDQSYTVVARTTASGEEVLLFTDRNYGPYGVVRICPDPNPGPSPVITIDAEDLLTRDGALWSGAFPGSITAGHPEGVHTLSATLADFVGTITVQGSLEDQPSTDDVAWFDVHALPVTVSTTGTVGDTFLANLTWVRFKIVTTDGSVERILFRN